ADMRDSPTPHDEEDERSEGECGGSCGEQPGCRWDQRLVLHMLRSEREDEDENDAHSGMRPEKPVRQAAAPDAGEVIGGKDGERRDRGKDVAGKLGAGEGEEGDGEEGPQDKELGEGIARSRVTQIALRVVAYLPLGDRDLDRVNQRADGDDGPWHQ